MVLILGRSESEIVGERKIRQRPLRLEIIVVHVNDDLVPI